MRVVPLVAIVALLAMPLFADGTPDGAALFKSKCALCHGPDGSGQTPVGKSMNLKPLSSAEIQKQSDAELGKTISDGKGKMLPYKSKLTAEEIKAIVAHIRTLKK